MWIRQTYWLDLSTFLSVMVLGTICFGRFEDWKPRWRRVLKALLSTMLFIGLLQLGGRVVAWGVVGALFVAALSIHAVWLPKHGINGWTAEPRDKYLELVRKRNRI